MSLQRPECWAGTNNGPDANAPQGTLTYGNTLSVTLYGTTLDSEIKI